MAAELLPRPQGGFLNENGSPRDEWFNFLRNLAELLDTAESEEERIAALEAAVAALQAAGATVEITGPASIRVMGSAADGFVFVLDGDAPAPGDEMFYGTRAGLKGWHERLLATLADVDVTGLADGDFLAWNATDEVFEPVAAPSARFPLVTGEVPPVLVYADDGSLITV